MSSCNYSLMFWFPFGQFIHLNTNADVQKKGNLKPFYIISKIQIWQSTVNLKNNNTNPQTNHTQNIIHLFWYKSDTIEKKVKTEASSHFYLAQVNIISSNINCHRLERDT